MSFTFLLVGSEISSAPLKACETVCGLTPAARAISFTVTLFVICFSSLTLCARSQTPSPCAPFPLRPTQCPPSAESPLPVRLIRPSAPFLRLVFRPLEKPKRLRPPRNRSLKNRVQSAEKPQAPRNFRKAVRPLSSRLNTVVLSRMLSHTLSTRFVTASCAASFESRSPYSRSSEAIMSL